MPRSSKLHVRLLSAAEMPEVGRRIAAMEKAVTYPLGDDSFHIDHGLDYFAFFRRMGKLCYLVAERDDELLGMLAAVRREFPPKLGGPAWYLGDLKITGPGRGLFLARRLLRAMGQQDGPTRYFGISMNPGDGTPNRVVQLVRRMFPTVRAAATLNFYSLDAEEMNQHRALVENHRGPISFLSLSGVKDIILTSTGKPMPLLHVQHGPLAARGAPEPNGPPTNYPTEQPGCTHMFCSPMNDELDIAAQKNGLEPTATATVLDIDRRTTPAHSSTPSPNENIEWSWILTSDI